ncbi:hypothetical protein AMTRI_Chr05g63960 [Amborella trichopoda]
MAGSKRSYSESVENPLPSSKSGNGVCMMSNAWRDKQQPAIICFIASFLSANSYRLNFLPIAPDFIVNNGGVSVAFIFITNWDYQNIAPTISRIKKLKCQFGHFYAVITVSTKEQNESFIKLFFEYGIEIGRPTFIVVENLEIGFEKIVNIAHINGECKRQNAISKLKIERERSVQGMEAFIKVVTSIPGLENHDANALIQAIGSIEAISKASKEFILENTDLSPGKAETIVRFFKDLKYSLCPKII